MGLQARAHRRRTCADRGFPDRSRYRSGDRKSFAAYYYTTEAPTNWTGVVPNTKFAARPDEFVRGYLLMPAQRLQDTLRRGLGWAKRGVKRTLGGP